MVHLPLIHVTESLCHAYVNKHTPKCSVTSHAGEGGVVLARLRAALATHENHTDFAVQRLQATTTELKNLMKNCCDAVADEFVTMNNPLNNSIGVAVAGEKTYTYLPSHT